MKRERRKGQRQGYRKILWGKESHLPLFIVHTIIQWIVDIFSPFFSFIPFSLLFYAFISKSPLPTYMSSFCGVLWSWSFLLECEWEVSWWEKGSLCAATPLIATLLSKHSYLYSKISAVPSPHQISFPLQEVGANAETHDLVKVLRKRDRPCPKYINYFYEELLFFKVLFIVLKFRKYTKSIHYHMLVF